MKKPKVLAIISARGGSKRIPNKNIRDFCGKPLIAYTILQGIECGFIDRVMVDTDSPKIANVAKKYGAQVPWLRPAKLANDKAKVVDSLLYNLQRFKKQENYVPDYVVVLQLTSPLRETKDILDAWHMMQTTNATTVLTVCPTHPKFYHLNNKQNIVLVNGNERSKSPNTDAWPQGYLLNNFLYIVKTTSLIKEKIIITKNTKALICPHWRGVDIDVFEDWALAETLYKNREIITKRIKQLSDAKR